MERMRGIEPPSRAWEARVLPLNHIRAGPILSAASPRLPQALEAGGRNRCSTLRRMILSDRSIREEIATGRIEIDPFDDRCAQPSSVDLHVDRTSRSFQNARYPSIDVKVDQPDLTESVEVEGDNPFIPHPGEFVLGSTLERVRLPDDLVARLEGKSSYAGMRVGQISFFPLTSPAERPHGAKGRGRKHQGQREPTASRFFEEFAPEARTRH